MVQSVRFLNFSTECFLIFIEEHILASDDSTNRDRIRVRQKHNNISSFLIKNVDDDDDDDNDHEDDDFLEQNRRLVVLLELEDFLRTLLLVNIVLGGCNSWPQSLVRRRSSSSFSMPKLRSPLFPSPPCYQILFGNG